MQVRVFMPLARVGRRRLGPKKTAGIVSVMLAAMSTCRVAVLYLESVSAVRADRQADLELLELCASGQARGSPKMRDACLKAQADRAAPIVMKALMRSCSIAWREFLDNTGSPVKLLLVVLCVLSALVLPVIPMMRVAFGAVRAVQRGSESDSDSDDSDAHALAQHFIDVRGATAGARSNLRRRLRGLMPHVLRMASDDRRIDELEQQKGMARLLGPVGGWSNVELGPAGHSHRD